MSCRFTFLGGIVTRAVNACAPAPSIIIEKGFSAHFLLLLLSNVDCSTTFDLSMLDYDARHIVVVPFSAQTLYQFCRQSPLHDRILI